MVKCPFCNKISFGADGIRLKEILYGISKEMDINKKKESYPNYGMIINETVAWSLFQEKNHKYSAPADIPSRIKAVININYPDTMVEDEIIKIMAIHVSDILRLVERNPDDPFAKGYDMQRIYFNEKKYWNRKV